METVGIRELKTNFSRYLIRVKLGETIIVTDRKKEVAVITPFGQQADDKKLFDLMDVKRFSQVFNVKLFNFFVD